MLRLGLARGKAGEVAQARTAFERAAALARGLTHAGDPRGPNLFARAVLGQGGEWWVGTGRPDVELLREAIDALGSRDSELRAQLLSRMAVTLCHVPDAQARRITLSQEAVERPPTRPRATGDLRRTAGRPATAIRSGNAFQLDGEFWTLEYQHVVRRLKDARGLRYLAALVHAPEREFHVLDLAALTARPAAPSGRVGLEVHRGQLAEDVHPSNRGDAGTPLDARARDAYRQRVKDLEGDREEAERFHDPERAARAQAEIEFIRGQLVIAYGLHGRPRRLGGADEQARKNVTNCIRHSLSRIEQTHPALGRHLRRSIKTGILCSYRPEQPTAWNQ